MKLATHPVAAFCAALTLVSSAFGYGNGPNYDPTKNMLFPGATKSQALYSVFNNSGEFGVAARAQKKGGKLKRVRDLEMSTPGVQGLAHVAAIGGGSLVKVSSTEIKETMNLVPASDGQSMQVFFRNKKGKVISGKAQVSISGQFWFETYKAIKDLEKQVKGDGKIAPVYTGTGAQRPRGATVSSYVQLDDGVLSTIKEITLQHIKAVVMALEGFRAGESSFGFDPGDPESGTPADPILTVFGGISSIANGIVRSLLLNDPNLLPSLVDQFLSTSPEVIGLIEGTLTDLINTILAGGPIQWDEIVQDIQELVDIPVKQLSEDFQFIVEYSWPPEQRDLDTGTTFLGNTVGFAYNTTAPYMNWTGDDTTTGGSEIAAIDLNGAAEAGALPSSFQVTCKAGWYSGNGGSGPATLHMYLLNQRTGMRFGEVTREISPGTQSGPATTPVGSASFTYANDTQVLQFSID